MNELIAISESKARECRIKSRAYSIWLSSLVPANVVLVIGGALLSLIAGSSLLIEQNIISPTLAGFLAIISSAFAIIHTKLNCDQHQAECKKLRNIYKGLEEDYLNLKIVEDKEDLRERIEKLNSELSHIIKNAAADPSEKSLRKARNEVS